MVDDMVVMLAAGDPPDRLDPFSLGATHDEKAGSTKQQSHYAADAPGQNMA